MPLEPQGTSRLRLHQRNIRLEGFKRADGLWDIEAHLVDTKDQHCPLPSGLRRAGEAVHDIWVRATINGKMDILEMVVCADALPYTGYCERIAPDYSRVVGLNLFRGFLKAVKDMFGGTRGCSHITELLMFLPTAALQTLVSEVGDNEDGAEKPYPLDKCHALDTHSEVVQRYYPRWYRNQ